ncbi:MAG: branched-chain amino acid ABC transporter permease [Proteobacteria bacterium]|nr:branched-chain amino acid ABC transporter permease [Pseudomonadota bacterium]
MKSKLKTPALLLFLMAAFAFPAVVKDVFFIHLGVVFGIWIILAFGLNLIVGYTGQVSFCHAAFMGIGAYVSALLTLRAGFNFWTCLPFGIAAAGLLALLIGLPSFRLRGAYFSIITLAFGELVRIVFHNWRAVTNGPDGIPAIPAPPSIPVPLLSRLDFSEKWAYYYLVLVAAVICGLMLYAMVRSRLGRAFLAIREDESYAQSIGINTMRYKLLSFVLGAMFAGLAGCLYAHYFLYISPDSFTVFQSFDVLLMVIVGGMGSIVGPVIGVIFLTALPEYLHLAAGYRMVIYGFLLMVITILAPLGIRGAVVSAVNRFNRRSEGLAG